MKIAIVGSGISGLGAAWILHRAGHAITVFEKNDYIGGHSNTAAGAGHAAVDTGFIVFNEWTYPNLIALFDYLRVPVQDSDMSFAVSVDRGRIEYSSNALFAQKKNLFNPAFYRMIRDLLRFYREAPDYLTLENDEGYHSLGSYLADHGYSHEFIDWHIAPMTAAIWSTPAKEVMDFPFHTFIDFCVNHGLLLLKNRPTWRTVTGGSREYVKIITAPFRESILTGTPVTSVRRMDDHVLVNGESFDHIIMAGHADQSLALLQDASAEETETLKAFRYIPNTAYLHRDETLMPMNRKTWSSWNYLTSDNHLVLSYWMNRLQKFLPRGDDLFVTLNPPFPPDPAKTLKIVAYDHPAFNLETQKAQPNIAALQGVRRTWFCGAWCGYGFHEDGLSSGLAVAEKLSGTKRPWTTEKQAFAEGNAVGIG